MKTSHLKLKLVELNFIASFTTDDQSNFNLSTFGFKIAKGGMNGPISCILCLCYSGTSAQDVVASQTHQPLTLSTLFRARSGKTKVLKDLLSQLVTFMSTIDSKPSKTGS